MIQGRTILAFAAFLLVAAVPALPSGADTTAPEGSLRFNVLRDGDSIGEHRISFQGRADRSLSVGIDIDLGIAFGPFTLFEYSHRNRTLWQSGRLVSLQSETNDDGTSHTLRAMAATGGLRIEPGNGEAFDAPPTVLPSTYWMISTIRQSRLLNSQTGELLDISVRKVGRENVPSPAGPVPATHYRIDGDLELDLWYDDEDVLVRLGFDARGSRIDYRLIERTGRIPVTMAGTVMNARS